MAKSTNSRRRGKPQKPYPEFPLFPHATGRWAKKIRQKLHYFGKIADDPKGAAALEQFQREWPYLSEGRTPPPIDTAEFCTMRELCNAFLTTKRNNLITGELSERSFRDYYKTTDLLIDQFGKDRRVDDLRPDDFERLRRSLARRLGPVALGNTIARVRMVFKYAFDQRLVDQPIHYGQSFNRPSKRVLRKARQQSGKRMFEREELVRILDALDGKPFAVEGEDEPVTLSANPMLKTMVLLAINCGFGQSDCANLPTSAVDLNSGWIDYPRPKTAVERRCPLWPETVAALRDVLTTQTQPADQSDSECVFLTKYGQRFVRVKVTQLEQDRHRRTPIDAVGMMFGRLLSKLNINGSRNFYAIRHTFETIGGESRDQVAVNAIMGHVDDSMAAVYRERISDERLQAVVETVRGWLWRSDGS